MKTTSESLTNAANPESWIDEYRDSLFKYALSRLRDVDSAEECLQETFAAALQSLKNFQGLASERSWLISILKRKIYDHFRRISRDSRFIAAPYMDDLGYETNSRKREPGVKPSSWLYDPSKTYEQKEFLKIVKHALSELPDRSARVFILREVMELSGSEISETMGISRCNLYVILFRARKRLRNAIRLKWLGETEKWEQPI